MYDRLDPNEILRTAERLQHRIAERFPSASLSKLAARLVEVTHETMAELGRRKRPNIVLRAGVGLFLAAALATLVVGACRVHLNYGVEQFSDLMQGVEATLGILFFLGTGVYTLVKLEDRINRARALRMIHKLRIVAHVVDMHQLTKVPEATLVGSKPTPSSPERTLTEFELRRYLDYCCELFALVGKVAAMHTEDLTDPQVLEAVDDLEDLTAGLTNKIWQKLIIVERWSVRCGDEHAEPAPPAR